MTEEQIPGQLDLVTELENLTQRKVVRWTLPKEEAIFDHKCDKLPEGMKFHKFKITSTLEEQHAFRTEGRYEREVVCPYCGRHIVYVFTNVLRSARNW
jgi:hypothetical protein